MLNIFNSIKVEILKISLGLFFLLSAFHLGFSQKNISIFHQITIDNGLSNNSINQIFQDKDGFIWIATQDGLNKYDGYNFKIYRHESDTNSLSSSNIKCIYEDSKGRLWIGTNYGGLNLYDKEKDAFIRCTDFYEEKRLKKSPDILSITEGPDGNIWMGTFYSGLIKYNPEKQLFEHFYTEQQIEGSTHPEIFKLEVYDKDQLLVPVFRKGLYVFNIRTNEFKRFSNNVLLNEILNVIKESNNFYYVINSYEGIIPFQKSGNSFFLSENYDLKIRNTYFKDLCKDTYGNYWAASAHGLFLKTSEGISIYRNNPLDPYSLIDNNISCVFSDNNNGIWIGTQNRGISYYTYTSDKFSANRIGSFKVNELFNIQINDIAADNEGNFWLATEGKGIFCINPANSKITNYTAENIGFEMNEISCIHVDSKTKGIWIGATGGLSYWDRITNRVHIFPEDGSANGISWSYVQTIFEDNEGQIWVGLNGGGLNKYNRADGTFKHFKNDYANNKSISANGITAILVDSKSQHWFGSRTAGLNLLNIKDSTFERICVLCPKNNSFEDVTIYCIKEPTYPGLWIGTSSGLVYYNHKTGVKKHYTTKDGLPDNTINSIEIDSEGNLWLGTNNGFSRAVVNGFDKITQNFEGKVSFTNYHKNDGFLSLTFPPNSSCASVNGEILFGSLNGLVSFNPKNIKASEFQPNIIITQLRIGDRIMEINDTINNQLVLKKNISMVDHLVLNYKNRNFSIDFAALDFSAPLRNQYMYMLDGYDKEWRKTDGNRRTATYTNLDHGTYKLLIKGSNCDGFWSSKTREIKITVIPPWWQSWWAYLIYFIIVAILFVFYYNIMTSRVDLKKTLEYEKKSREKEEELNQLKSRFFTNITHEFKTPITLILGPTEQILEQASEESSILNKVRSIHSNAVRMLNLINELLSIRKIETGKEKLSIKEIDITDFAKNIAFAFNESAAIRKMVFETTIPDTPIKIFIDPFKIEKVIYNILSNAFKFSPNGSNVNFSLAVEKPDNSNTDFVALKVRDNGIGIPANELDKIFDRFYVHNSHNSMNMGIGLSLAKDYVEMHKGKIKVESIEKLGTVITVFLHLGKEHYQPNDIQVDNEDYQVNIEFLRDNMILSETELVLPDIRNNLPSLLIVEDNKELQQFICNSLQNIYNIIKADNGEEGEKLAKEHIPDLIISDIMMPVKDGINMCKELKSNVLTSHIPIILLTARSQEEDKIEAYQLGADAYIPKPFNLKHLKVRIKNLVDQRNLVKVKYMQLFEKDQRPVEGSIHYEVNMPVAEIIVKDLDEKFLNRLFETINNNITDPELNIDKICNILGMSYHQLYRKVKALTDLSVKDLIIKSRLKAAAKLLIEGKVNVSEAGYITGFNSPAYFTKSFREHFGVTPTEYIEKNN